MDWARVTFWVTVRVSQREKESGRERIFAHFLHLRVPRHERMSPAVAAAVQRCRHAGLMMPEVPTLAPLKAELRRSGN